MIAVSAILRKEQTASLFNVVSGVGESCHGDQTTVGMRWKKWRRAFELFVVGLPNAQQKKALPLHCGGIQLQDIYFTFTDAPEPGENETVYDVSMKQFDGHFAPQVNSAYERHLFRDFDFPTKLIDFTKMV